MSDTNLYGPGDNFNLLSRHVVPALIRKAHAARIRGDARLTIWGSGMPRRQFLHVDDCTDALILLLKTYSDDTPISVGSGQDLTILELAEMVCDVVGFEGLIACDTSKPDGTPRKLMSAERIKAMGWSPSIGLREGLVTTYEWFLANVAKVDAQSQPK
jgi:GDP-L-fucose synthase